jgi:(aminoalkyl)phosphonate N-acetyltransferase
MTTRKTTEQDLETVYQFVCELEEEILDKAAFNLLFLENLKQTTICGWLVEIEHEAVGFISVHLQNLIHHAAQVAEIQEFYVSPLHRSSGIGKVLLQVAETWAVAQGVTEIELSTNQKRTQAHKFYLREGYANTHFKMTKRIG